MAANVLVARYIDGVIGSPQTDVPENTAGRNSLHVAVGERTSLNELWRLLRDRLLPRYPRLKNFKPLYRDFRAGDVRHTLADIGKARRRLGYRPDYGFARGLDEALDWYVAQAAAPSSNIKI